MKKLSDFKDVNAVCVVADLMEPIMAIVQNPKNADMKREENAFKMFSAFFKNSAEAMLQIFAILSETPVDDYHCDGVEVIQNLLTLSADSRLVELFTSQGQTGDAISSGSASVNTEE